MRYTMQSGRGGLCGDRSGRVMSLFMVPLFLNRERGAVPTVWIILAAVFVALNAGPVVAEQHLPTANRQAIRLLVSPLQYSAAVAIGERVAKKYNLPQPEITSMLAYPAVKAFCAGVGSGTPDVIGLPRQMTRSEYERCTEHGVVDIVELRVGFDALVLVVRKGEAVFNLTPRGIYFAMAAQIPLDDEFVANDTKLWSDISTRLPNIPIMVYGSDNGTAINNFFKEIFMEGGCRGLRQFKIFYSSVDRVKTCTTIREDGRYVGIKAPIAVNFRTLFQASPPGSLGVLPYTVYRRNAEWLQLLPVNNIFPTDETIKNDTYEAVFPVRYYVKRKHMERSLGGTGVVRGLYSFIEELMSEEAIGNGGYLEGYGLVVDDPVDRQNDRESAMRLQPYRR